MAKFIACLMLLLHIGAVVACEPKEVEGGTGSQTFQVTTASGIGWWHYCDNVYNYTFYYNYVPYSSFIDSALSNVRRALMSPENYRRAIQQHMTGRYCEISYEEVMAEASHFEICSAIHESIKANLPRRTWTVVPLIAVSDQSRPMYAVVNGVRSTRPVAERAEADALCICNKNTAIAAGNDNNRWCPVAHKPINLVSLCRKNS